MEESIGCFTLIVFLLSCRCLCSVCHAIICDCGITCSYSLVVFSVIVKQYLLYGADIVLVSPKTLNSSKVRKRAKIKNRYNQAPHLTQEPNGKMTTSQLDITNKSQEVSPFPAGDNKASINRRARKHNKNKTEIT